MPSGVYDLGDFQITTAVSSPPTIGTVVDNLEGIAGLLLSARFAYGSGGTAVVATVQTSLNQGTTWIDIARFDFSNAGAEKIINLIYVTPITSPYANVALVAEGGISGIIGDRFRAVVTSTGTYAGSTVLAIRATVR